MRQSRAHRRLGHRHLGRDRLERDRTAKGRAVQWARSPCYTQRVHKGQQAETAREGWNARVPTDRVPSVHAPSARMPSARMPSARIGRD